MQHIIWVVIVFGYRSLAKKVGFAGFLNIYATLTYWLRMYEGSRAQHNLIVVPVFTLG